MIYYILTYLTGIATPFIIWFGVCMKWTWDDYRAAKRYQRAWDRFSKEFDELDPKTLNFYQGLWKQAPSRYEQICDDRSRYFNMRWNHGHTTDA